MDMSQLDIILTALASGDPWWYDEEHDKSIIDLIREQICLMTDVEIIAHASKSVACGSVAIEDTARGLYRLLFLLRPPHVSFTDMYKTAGGLFVVADNEKRFIVSVELYKYALGLYFYCPPHLVENPHSNHGLTAGWPGADNGWRITDMLGATFFAMVTKAAQTPLGMYGGNNFIV